MGRWGGKEREEEKSREERKGKRRKVGRKGEGRTMKSVQVV